MLVKGVPVCLKSLGIVDCERQPFNLKHRSNSAPESLSLSAELDFYILSTVSTKWPAWLEAKQ